MASGWAGDGQQIDSGFDQRRSGGRRGATCPKASRLGRSGGEPIPAQGPRRGCARQRKPTRSRAVSLYNRRGSKDSQLR